MDTRQLIELTHFPRPDARPRRENAPGEKDAMSLERDENILTARDVAVLIVAVAAPFMLARYYKNAEYWADTSEAVYSALEREAEELNATLPEMVSEGVLLDKATAGPGNSFNYAYTIVDDDAARGMVENPGKLNDLRKQLHERVCMGMPDLRANGTIVRYSLKDGKGATIADVSINPGDC